MSFFDVFRVSKIKAELAQANKERDLLKTAMAGTERMNAYELQKVIAALEERKTQVTREIEATETEVAKKRQSVAQQITELNQQITARKQQLIVLDEETLLQSFGFYTPRYDLQTSELYKAKLEHVREQQETMVKTGKAAYGSTSWSVNNSQKEGERMVKDYVKLILRSFNNECDASITNVKFNNIEQIEKKIRKAHETLNKLGERMSIVVAPQYRDLKLQELHLCHEYQVKKQQEKEEQKRIREQMREEAKLLKEIEEMKLKLEKEEKHFHKALETINRQLQQAKTEVERQALENEKVSIEQKIAVIDKDKHDVENREQNTRAGYVYIISNVGSFGENVYKIGVTRRLVPEERVDELGDASVPFDFDIHALVFSDDAPMLENALHKAFERQRLNMINRRREFFHITLDEIESVVKTNFNKPVDFIRLADADEYRQSLVLKGASNGAGVVRN